MANPENLVRMALQGSFLGLAAFAMSFLMIAGEIDLSSGATAGLGAAVAGALMMNLGWSEWASCAAALAVAVLVGLLNAFIVLKIRMPSFFATLGTSFLVSGLAIWILKGAWFYVGDQIPSLLKVLNPSPLFALPWIFIALLIAYLVGDLLMRTSRLGPTLTAVGGNRRAAEIVGINVPLVKTLCFVFVSVCCGLAGILVMVYCGHDGRDDRGRLAALGDRDRDHRRRQPPGRNREHHRCAPRDNPDPGHPHGPAQRQCADQCPGHCDRGDLAWCCLSRRPPAQERPILAQCYERAGSTATILR